MKPLSALVLALAMAGCGAATDGTNVPASSGVESVEPAPPTILLVGSGGEQSAVRVSFCVDYVDPASREGTGVCGDTGPIHPDEVTVARPGDDVTFVVEGAGEVSDASVSVKPLGCDDREVERIPLSAGEQTPWTVDLEPGAYQLDVFAKFEAANGASGDVSGSLGLLVKADAPPRTVPVDLDLAVCPLTD